MADGDQWFIDEVPDSPLMWVRYNNGYALSLVAESGWVIKSVEPPSRYIQNYIVCRPA